MKLPLAGGCLCGAIRYQISAEPRSADYCHCSMCRRAAGAPVVARLTVANEAFAWSTGQLAVYRSAQEAERMFYPKCGTQLDYLDVTLASLDTPEAVRPSYHIWTASRIGWFDTADDLPRYPGSLRGDEPRRRRAVMGLGAAEASCGAAAGANRAAAAFGVVHAGEQARAGP